MKIVVLCEGETERRVIPDLLSRWLNSRVLQRIGMSAIPFDGWSDLVRGASKKASLYLGKDDVVGVIALLDLYGPTFYPVHLNSTEQRRIWGIKHMQDELNDPRYRVHFAVHEVEAWILSQPDILDPRVRKKLPGKAQNPETVNSNQPPAKLLDQIYSDVFGKGYKKVVEGTKLFSKLNPEIVYDKCPAFKALADDLLLFCPPEIRRDPN